MTEKSPDKMTMKIEMGQDFRRYHANGIYGGVTPRGELELYFIEDISPIPQSFRLGLVDGNRYMEEEAQGAQPTRMFNASVTLPLSALPSIIVWLQDKIKVAEQTGLLVSPVSGPQVKQ